MRLQFVSGLMLIIAALPPQLSLAQSVKTSAPVMAADTARALQSVSKLPHVIFHPGEPDYPEMLAKNGVQGIVTLEINLSKEGKVKAARIIGSSRSAALDENALAFAKDGWLLPDNGLKYFEGLYSLNIIFVRDTVLTINKKTCADFNTDYRYFRFIRPAGNNKDIGAFELLANIFTVQLIKTQGAVGSLKFVKAVDAINEDTIQACAKKPKELLVKTYVKAAQKHGIKF
ncbi:MAG: energy transducer TonB [Arenimonas sp.]